ncbi:hypothetical protein THAOC_26849, partial [Thalassiosira oceanica]
MYARMLQSAPNRPCVGHYRGNEAVISLSTCHVATEPSYKLEQAICTRKLRKLHGDSNLLSDRLESLQSPPGARLSGPGGRFPSSGTSVRSHGRTCRTARSPFATTRTAPSHLRTATSAGDSVLEDESLPPGTGERHRLTGRAPQLLRHAPIDASWDPRDEVLLVESPRAPVPDPPRRATSGARGSRAMPDELRPPSGGEGEGAERGAVPAAAAGATARRDPGGEDGLCSPSLLGPGEVPGAFRGRGRYPDPTPFESA